MKAEERKRTRVKKRSIRDIRKEGKENTTTENNNSQEVKERK